jgi:ADP-L-glycero-D-manno-heptose 6-epimerase
MIVVTGGAGFIGSNLVAGLEKRLGAGGPDLVVVDRLGQDDKWKNIAKRDLAAIVPPEEFMGFLERHAGAIEVIFHLGAISATTERDADLIVRENVTLPLNLWQWCTTHGTRLIYASSAATYGDGDSGFDDDTSPDGLARLRPMNAYGWSKHLFDRRATKLAANGVHPPQWAGLKFFNFYGPNEYHKAGQQSVVRQVHAQAARGDAAVLFRSHRPDYPDGGQLRDFIWVGDCVDVMLWLYDNPRVSGLFNVGTGKARSFADLTAAVFTALGRETRIAYTDTPAALRDRYQYFTEARTERLRAAGFPGQFTPLEEGVRRYVQNHLEAEDPYR